MSWSERAVFFTLALLPIAWTVGVLAWGLTDRLQGTVVILDSSFPAWIQAIGALISVGVAVYIPHRISQLERAEQARRDRIHARSVALQLLPWFQHQRAALDYARVFDSLVVEPGQRMTRYGLGVPVTLYSSTPGFRPVEVDHVVETVRIPSELTALVPTITALGSAAERVQAAILAAYPVPALYEAIEAPMEDPRFTPYLLLEVARERCMNAMKAFEEAMQEMNGLLS